MDDYRWVTEDELFSAFCMAWVPGLTPQQVIERLPVTERLGRMTCAELEARTWREWGDAAPTGRGPAGLLVGVTTIADAAMTFEVNGWIGVTESILATLSEGGRVVGKHYSDGNYHAWLNVFDDGEWTMGVDTAGFFDEDLAELPADLATSARASGLRSLDQDNAEDTTTDNEPAAFALFEALTGVRITPETFRTASFEVVRVPIA